MLEGTSAGHLGNNHYSDRTT